MDVQQAVSARRRFDRGIPPGTYAGVCGGFACEFTANGVEYEARLPEYVRTANTPCTVTVAPDGTVTVEIAG